MTDEQRKAYVAALVNEKGGYEARLKDAKANAATGEVERLEGRIESVKAELKRVQDEAKTPHERATRAKRAPRVSE